MAALWLKVRAVLPCLLAKATRTRRYRPEIAWSRKSWTHNLFRVYELIFWRREGIRPESSVTSSDKEYIQVYTFEALCAYFETWLRSLAQRQWVEVTQIEFVNNPYRPLLPQINFAIAWDANANSTSQSASPVTWNHTCTGSNLMLAMAIGAEASTSQPNTTGVTYNTVGSTKARGDQNPGTSSVRFEGSLWFLAGPATGSNQVSGAFTATGTIHVGGASTSYSGAQASSVADASNGINNGGLSLYTSGADQTMTVTTIADNCWVVAVGINQGTAGATTVGDQTERVNFTCINGGTIFGRMVLEDTNAAQTPPGSVTVGFKPSFTGSSRGFTLSAASFAPAAAATFIAEPGLNINQAINRASNF